MPDMPHVTIDRRHHKMYFDGVEFPWIIAERGPEAESIAAPHELPVVLVPIVASDVEVIPADEKNSN